VKIFKGIKQLLCKHTYVACKYRALNATDELTYICLKCEKRKVVIER